jgi:hypothetical protein
MTPPFRPNTLHEKDDQNFDQMFTEESVSWSPTQQ